MQPTNGLSAIMLAAGGSSRMAGKHKLLQPFGKSTIIEQAVANLVPMPFAEIVVVLGYRAKDLRCLLEPYPVKVLENPDFEQGMGHSLAQGVAAASKKVNGYLIALGDMPLIKQETIAALANNFGDGNSKLILVPTTAERRGHPVIFGSAYRQELTRLHGDTGAKSLLRKYASSVQGLEVNDAGIHQDVDTWADYEHLRI